MEQQQSLKQRRRQRVDQGSACRACAAAQIFAVLNGKSLTQAQQEMQERFKLSARDQGLCSELSYGVLRHLRLLQLTLRGLSAKQSAGDQLVESLVFCGLYQCALMDRVPLHAAVSSTVGACGLLGRRQAAPYVNAVLRRFLREGGTLAHSDDPAVQYSFPGWMVRRLTAAYGKEQTAEILAQSNARAPMFLRVETDKISTAAYAELLHEAGIAVKRTEASGLIELSTPVPVSSLPLFNDGQVSVQDRSAQLPVQVLALADGQQVLDCCCAPGGKSAQICASGHQLHLTACDSAPERLAGAAANLQRLGRLPPGKLDPQASCFKGELLTVKLQDAALLNPEQHGLFDRILLDAPCSGSGVIRRHPDIKWLRRESDLTELTALQAKILQAAWSCLKAGGILVYSTCSIFPEENVQQIERFTAAEPQAQLLPFDFQGQQLGMRQILPGDDGGDGFFYARLIKRAGA